MNSNFAMTLIGLIVAMIAIMSFTGNTRENFIDVPRTVKTMPIDTNRGQLYGMKNDYQQKMLYDPSNNNKFYQTAGTWQSQLSPRMSGGTNFGANIRYNMPSIEHMAIPCDPLTFSTMTQENYKNDTRENYCGSCSSPAATCGKGGLPGDTGIPISAINAPDSTSPSYQQAMDSLNYQATTSELPVGDLTAMDSNGDSENPIVFDRYIFANQKSRLYALGDHLRGDLPIVPALTGWFRPSVHPNIDLRSGALAVMGGSKLETANELWDLQYNSSGKYDTTLGGVNMTTQMTGAVNQQTNDVQFSAFP
jgi:hypothetical protein